MRLEENQNGERRLLAEPHETHYNHAFDKQAINFQFANDMDKQTEDQLKQELSLLEALETPLGKPVYFFFPDQSLQTLQAVLKEIHPANTTLERFKGFRLIYPENPIEDFKYCSDEERIRDRCESLGVVPVFIEFNARL